MPILPQQNPNIPFLRNYIAYSLPQSMIPCDYVQDMITYSIQQNSNTVIDFYVGPKEIPEFVLSVKNQTEETRLTVMLEYNSNFFRIKKTMQSAYENPVQIAVLPKEQTPIFIHLNPNYLNSRSDYEKFDTQIKMTVRNLANGKLAFKNVNTSELIPEALSSPITVK